MIRGVGTFGGKIPAAPFIESTHKVMPDRVNYNHCDFHLYALIRSFFYPKRRNRFSQNPIGRFSAPKGNITPGTVDFKGSGEYTERMND